MDGLPRTSRRMTSIPDGGVRGMGVAAAESGCMLPGGASVGILLLLFVRAHGAARQTAGGECSVLGMYLSLKQKQTTSYEAQHKSKKESITGDRGRQSEG
jgi:hypothetical protein